MRKRYLFSQLFITVLCIVLFSTQTLAASGINQSVQPESTNITIYYPNGDWEFTKTNIVVPDNDKYLNALNLLVESGDLPVGCYDEFPDGIHIDKFEINNGIAFISINENVLDQIDKNTYAVSIMQSILGYNIFNFDKKITQIKFLLNNLPSRKFSNLVREDFFESGKLLNVGKVPKFDLDIAQLQGKNPDEIRALVQQAILKEKSSFTNKEFSAMSTYKVCIDPGHGGSESGAVVNGIYEKNLNLPIGLAVRNELNSWTAVTFTVIMTRTTDTDVSLTQRYNIANNNDVDCFVSVHCNTASSSTPSGCTAVYPSNHDITNSKMLATRLVSAIDSSTSLSQYGSPYMDNRSLAVLNGTNMPAAIVECGFMTNSTDLNYLKNNPNTIGVAIGYGISYWCQLYA